MSIALAVWGREFVERFLEMPLASHAAALAAFGGDVRYLLYTDDDSLAKEITRATGMARPMHWWFASHSIRICGDADCGDAEVFRELSERHGHR